MELLKCGSVMPPRSYAKNKIDTIKTATLSATISILYLYASRALIITARTANSESSKNYSFSFVCQDICSTTCNRADASANACRTKFSQHRPSAVFQNLITFNHKLNWAGTAGYILGQARTISERFPMTKITAYAFRKKEREPSHLCRKKKELVSHDRKLEARYCSFRREIR